MAVEKMTAQTLRFTGNGCSATVNSQVVLSIEVADARQTMNFPVIELPAVAALLAALAGDADVADLIVVNTPPPEPEPDPDLPEGETIP